MSPGARHLLFPDIVPPLARHLLFTVWRALGERELLDFRFGGKDKAARKKQAFFFKKAEENGGREHTPRG